MLIDENVRSTIPLSVGVTGRDGWTEMPSDRQAVKKVSDALP
ncbi:hypothetical protein [Streptomyces kanamyceticus]